MYNDELEVAERWYADSALEDRLGICWPQVNESRLYRGLDVLLEHKKGLCAHSMRRYQPGFGVRLEFLLYDVTITFFKGQARADTKAAWATVETIGRTVSRCALG